MDTVDKDEFKRVPFDEESVTSKKTPTSESSSSEKKKTVPINSIILCICPKYEYQELKDLIKELKEENKYLSVDETGKRVSILHCYALKSTREPIDISNQDVRFVYRPSLFTQKNDAFGPWKFHYLLGLFDLYYECGEPDRREQFPEVWKTHLKTKVHILEVGETTNDVTTSMGNSSSKKESSEEEVTLKDHLQVICRQNNCKEKDADSWLVALQGEGIFTVEHLRNAAANEAGWEKLSSIKYLIKQRIRDYIQLNTPSQISNTSKNPYDESKATLIADIHRLRRYFHYVTETLEHIPYLDRNAVDCAIIEIKKVYDDDGNVLNTIHAYLKTFCLRNVMVDKDAHEQQRSNWEKERNELLKNSEDRRNAYVEVENLCSQAEQNVKVYELRLGNLTQQKKQKEEEKQKLIVKMAEQKTRTMGDDQKILERLKNEIRSLDEQIPAAEKSLDEFHKKLIKSQQKLIPLAKRKAEEDAKIQDLDSCLALDLPDEHRKLNVKFGRGLLLYGPPGTGKSELLKRAATFAGITMTTTPLAAGELNRPYVGETERLLVDIMYRAATIPYLICAMTIDEIDGLVPKRDNNAQQSKVDGISVLLSHIEGVKNIPNLIVFGATNRRNVMDEAFLRRMQAKCFVGRPSPQIRKKMLRPLLCKDSRIFSNKLLDFLVNITTNFSGAAVGALKSSIIVAMDQDKNQAETLTEHTLLTLADNAAREFSCWFGIETLPEICRLYPDIFKSTDCQEKYSLRLPKRLPSGRILVDLQDRKCLIELMNEPSLEDSLSDNETSTSTLISRFISGCSSRNIDTIQIIDLNFLIKYNAFDEQQRFELLTTTFLECEEYNRSMLIFDIDSLVMLNVSDSYMSKSVSISNIQMYQFIREKCKKSIVEQKSTESTSTTTTTSEQSKEKWVVMIVKHPLLHSLLIDDIEFKQTDRQIQHEQQEEEKRMDDETMKTCPKCQQTYIQSKNDHGNCRYHDGYVYDLIARKALSNSEAQKLMQQAKLQANSRGIDDPQPKPLELIWTCCLGIYGVDSTCKVGVCGLPKELKDRPLEPNQSEGDMVQIFFKNNPVAKTNIVDFLATYKPKTTTVSDIKSTNRVSSSTSTSSMLKK